MLDYVRNRLQERSTWGGIIGVLTTLAAALTGAELHVLQYVIAIVGILAIIVPTKGL